MKITLLQDYLRCGSTEKQCVYLADYLKKHEQDVTILTFRPGGLLAADVNEKRIKHVSLQPFDTNMDWMAPGLLHEIAEQKPDIIICMGRMANGYAARICKHFPSIIVIGTTRTGRPLTQANIRAFERVPAIVANSEWWKDELISYGIEPERIHVIHSKLFMDWNPDDFKKERERLRTKMCATDNTTVFVNVATMRRSKHQAELIQGLSKLPTKSDWQLWLVGGGFGTGWINFTIDRLKLKDRVFLLGPQDDPAPFMAAADVAISTSVQDSQQRFLVEAQSLGLPVIAYNHAGTRECFKPNITGLLIGERDRKGITEAASILIQDKKLRQKMSKAAIEYAKKEFSGDHQGETFMKLIQNLWATKMAKNIFRRMVTTLEMDQLS